MIFLVLTLCVTIFVSFICSLFEATLFSTNVAAVENERTKGNRPHLAERFLFLKKNIAVPIASILILNTIAHTGGATLSGMFAAEQFGPSFVPLFSIVFSLVILFFTELMPKTLGVAYWRQLWPMIVWPLTAFNYALYPAIVLTQKFTGLFIRGKKMPSVTEEELLAMVRIGAKEREISERESRLVHNIIALEDKPIREIMTPRTVIFSLEAGMSIAQARPEVENRGVTRIPIYEDDRENILGYVLAHDLFSQRGLDNSNAALKTIAKPITFVPQTTDSLAVLTKSLRERKHIFIVIDEYGGVAGLLTLEDLIETILGDEIVDETDKVVDLQESARQRRRQQPTV